MRSEQKVNLVKSIPLENLLLESDAPLLGPVKYKRNEPKNVVVSAEKIAELKSVSVEDVAKATTANAKRLLGI
jgi:TatD DNase family protein